jgi:hypothetical protein
MKVGCGYENDNLLLWNLEVKQLTLLTNQIRCRCMEGVRDRNPHQCRWLPKSPNLAHRLKSLASQPWSILLLVSKHKNQTLGTGFCALPLLAGISERLQMKFFHIYFNLYTWHNIDQYFQVAMTDSSLVSVVWTDLFCVYDNSSHPWHLDAWEMKGGCAHKIDIQVLLLWTSNLRELALLTNQIRCRFIRESEIEAPTSIDGYRFHPTWPID